MKFLPKCAIFIGGIFFILGMFPGVHAKISETFYEDNFDPSFFRDVAVGKTPHPYVEALKALKEEKMITGNPDGTFAPDKWISRSEFVTMVTASLKVNPSTLTGSNCFKDVASEWFAKFACSAKQKGFVSENPDGTFRPGNPVNLAEASAIFIKAYEFSPKKLAMNELWYKPS